MTEDGLDMWGVVPVEDIKFQLPLKHLDKLPFSHLLTAMVTCHSLTLIDGKLNGDPLDLKVSIDLCFYLFIIFIVYFIFVHQPVGWLNSL